MRPILFKNIFIQLLSYTKISREEKIVAQHHRSATENRYTHTPHAYGSAIPTSARKITIPPERRKQPSFQGLYSYVLYFIPDKAATALG